VRDEFSQKVLDVLAKRVGVRCSNPGCRKLTTGPRSDPSRIVCIGVGAHITAASPRGKRYDPSVTSEQRTSEDNGIWLCQNDAKLVDNDDVRYTVAVLREWKRQAEAAALAELEGTSERRPEDAAELELSVGGVPVGGNVPVRTSRKGYDSSGYCDRHEYELVVTVRNLGDERLDGYHVDAEFPAGALEHPKKHAAYVPARSTRERAFFRASGAATPELFPGDPAAVLTLPYYVDHEMYTNWDTSSASPTARPHTFEQSVRVALYRNGLPPLVLEHPFKALQNF
jgi:hypothetical protein